MIKIERKKQRMLKAFKIFSVIEGLSLLALLFIAMPAKYQFGLDLVKYVGPIHGYLWLAYLPLLEIISRQQNWTKSMWSIGFLTSGIPFGFLYLSKKMKEQPLKIDV